MTSGVYNARADEPAQLERDREYREKDGTTDQVWFKLVVTYTFCLFYLRIIYNITHCFWQTEIFKTYN